MNQELKKKNRNYGNLLYRYVLYEKAVVAGRKQPLIINPPTLYFFKILCYFAHVPKSCKLNIFSKKTANLKL